MSELRALVERSLTPSERDLMSLPVTVLFLMFLPVMSLAAVAVPPVRARIAMTAMRVLRKRLWVMP